MQIVELAVHEQVGSSFVLRIITTRHRSCGKVMFSVVSICLYTGQKAGSHVTIACDTLDFTVQGLHTLPPSPDMGPHCTGHLPPVLLQRWNLIIQGPPFTLLVTSSGHHCRSIQTCSYQDPHGADIWWVLKQVRSAQVGGTHSTGMFSCSVNYQGWEVWTHAHLNEKLKSC